MVCLRENDVVDRLTIVIDTCVNMFHITPMITEVSIKIPKYRFSNFENFKIRISWASTVSAVAGNTAFSYAHRSCLVASSLRIRI